MSDFGHVEKITREVGGKECTFRSKLEYRWAVWCQLRKEQGIITDWFYENVEKKIETKLGEIKIYRPDFTIRKRAGHEFKDQFYHEFEETKGWLQQKDAKKMKLFAEQYENPLTLIFANLTNCKSARAQYGKAKRLEKLLESNGGRVIYDANKTIFKPIKHLFDC